jgi:hypothetical protein
MKKIDPKLVRLLERLAHLRKRDCNLTFNRSTVFEDKSKKRKGNRKQNNEVAIREHGELS